MEEWKTYKLGDLVNLYSGGTPNKSKAGYWGGSIPWISAKSMYEDFLATSDLFITESGLKAGSKLAKKDTILLLTRGSGLFNRIPVCWTERDLAFNQDVKNIVSKDDSILLNQYLYYWLYGNKAGITAILETTGIGAGKIDTERFLSLDVSIPSVDEQNRIIRIVGPIFDKIAINNRINHNLEEQAQALYKSWFVDFEPFKGGEFADSELGLIPAGWRVGTLSELGDIVAGGTPSKSKPEYYTNNGIAWLTPKDLSVKCNKFTARGETDITEDGYKNSSAKLMPRGSVLFSSRAPIGYISIAKGYICTNQGFKSVVPTYAGTAYIYYWLLENTDAIESQASGSTFKEASGSLMKSFPALVPEKSVLDSFEKELAPILNEQEVLEKEIYHAEQIRNSLLPRLMSGELVMNC
jgi:type I restriction enzyme S subunit